MQRQIKEVLAFSRAQLKSKHFPSVSTPTISDKLPLQQPSSSRVYNPATQLQSSPWAPATARSWALCCYLGILQGRFCFEHLEKAPCDSAACFPLQTRTVSPQNALQLLHSSVQTIKQQFAVKTFTKQTLERVITPFMSFTTSIPMLLWWSAACWPQRAGLMFQETFNLPGSLQRLRDRANPGLTTGI